MKRLLYALAIIVILLAIGQSLNLIPKISLEKYVNIPRPSFDLVQDPNLSANESAIVNIIEKAIPSVVTIGINKTTNTGSRIQIDPFNPFNPFETIPGEETQIQQNIGSGFIISSDGLIITNRHVVGDTEATYTVFTHDRKEHNVVSIFRDPLNDLAILKINAKNLKPLVIGDSNTLKLGQTTIAIGTPLGEFTNTVTTGIISGLGRGITAGSPFEGHVEKLDNVIQTDAAISQGNSGGPLLNSVGQVIGINTALATEGQNIGFAIPSNVISELVSDFQRRGSTFERPFLGVRYSIIDEETAEAENLVQGAYVVSVIEGSSADDAGIQEEDIIITIDGQKISDENQGSLAKIIIDKEIGDQITIQLYRSGQTISVQTILKAAS
ncbi:MAG: trypsin-like peptidase domain-containing protein [Patescibacteria group bacterium]